MAAPDRAWCPLDRVAALQEGVPAEPGLCGSCRYAKWNATRRGTTYLRCTRAAWDPSLLKYPQLPRLSCHGYEHDRAGE
jgi:hypothetical protein